MRIRRKRYSDEVLEKGAYLCGDKDNKIKFDDHKPLHLEIGMGRGRFIADMAKAHPEINFIGIEVVSNVFTIALKQILLEPTSNIALLNINVEKIEDYIECKIDHIYLNFSDPWPKKRHSKRRLTSPNFLHLYKRILKDNGTISLRTDNYDFFNYSLAEFTKFGFVCIINNNFPPVLTQYEEKFIKEGKPIYRVDVYLKGEKENAEC